MNQLFTDLFYLAFMILLIYRRPILKIYKETDFLYTALGDDISKSLIAFLCRGFVYRVNRYLKITNSNVIFNNFATPAYTSSDLLTQLKSCSDIRQSIRNSKIITISIGGNNLLKGVFENFSVIDGKTAKLQIDQFKADWPEILYFIRNAIGSKASIYIMTLYNPFSYDDPNYSIAEYYISNLNLIIKSDFFIRLFNYKVVDIHEYNRRNSNENFTFLSPYIRIPLPNYKEYKQIGDSFISTMKII